MAYQFEIEKVERWYAEELKTEAIKLGYSDAYITRWKGHTAVKIPSESVVLLCDAYYEDGAYVVRFTAVRRNKRIEFEFPDEVKDVLRRLKDGK